MMTRLAFFLLVALGDFYGAHISNGLERASLRV